MDAQKALSQRRAKLDDMANSRSDIHQAYTYDERMPADSPAPSEDEKPKRKAMFLGPQALRDLAATSARRRTEREAMEEALALLAERDAKLDALDDFVAWAKSEWGAPNLKEQTAATELWAKR